MTTAEERAEAAAIDVEGRQARIAEILGTGDPSAENQAQVRPARAKRKDAGHPRPKKAEPAAQVAGALTQEQADKIRTLAEAKIQALEAHTQSERIMIDACETLDAYLDSLVAK